jgi:hypothetical protein
MQLAVCGEGKEGVGFDICEMKEKFVQQRNVEAQYDWFVSALVEIYEEGTGQTLEDGVEPAEIVEGLRRVVRGRV